MDLKGLKNDFSAWILHRNRQFMRFYAGYAPFRGRGGRALGGIFYVIAEAENQCLRMIAEMLAKRLMPPAFSASASTLMTTEI